MRHPLGARVVKLWFILSGADPGEQVVTLFDQLQYLYEFNGGRRQTPGLDHATISRHAAADPRLEKAVHAARAIHDGLVAEHGAVLKLDEKQQIEFLLDGFVNFYNEETINPYVPLAGEGPWIVTSCGAVVFDAGGYGMLGQGHNPEMVLEALAQPQVMANIMTASFWHREFVQVMRREIGSRRPPGKRQPFKKFLCLNSGSESVTLGMRIADTNAFNLTSKGSVHQGKTIKFLSFVGSFHGRTERPAQASHSSLPNYRAKLASFRDKDNLITIEPNDIAALELAFKKADEEKVFIEALLFEPVMGEGNPGLALDPAFYQRARELSVQHGSMLIIDAIQAGLRAHGCLSIVDYPGFEKLDPPDIETYSKALNAGQFPLSVVAFGPRAQDIYARGTYGNTMTGNPRALAVACSVLNALTPELRANVVDRGIEAVAKLKVLAAEFPAVIEKVQGTGLLFSVAINPKVFKVIGADALETFLRKNGFGVIHGAANSLRYTPTFDITSLQIDLLVDTLRHALRNAPRLK
jgi:acetylornithine/succinyldiaminopimelate/putrescine aminotransferase